VNARRLSREDEAAIRAGAAAGSSHRELARKFGVSHVTIGKVVAASGTRAKHGTPVHAPEPPPRATPPAAGAPLVERVRALYGLAQSVRERLDAESDLAVRVAVDLVALGNLLARLERQSAGEHRTHDDLADAIESLEAMVVEAAAKHPVCEACDRPMTRGERPAEAAAAVVETRARAAAERAAGGRGERGDEIEGMVEELFGSLSGLAANATDPRTAQRYIRQSERLATVLARLEKHDAQIGFVIDPAIVAETDAWLRDLMGNVAHRRLLCHECGARFRRLEAEGESNPWIELEEHLAAKGVP
jgi:hypothetical protein